MPIVKIKNKFQARLNYTTNGKHLRKCSKLFDTKREANDYLLHMKQELESSERITFDSVFEEFKNYQENRVKRSTFIKYDSLYAHLEPLHNVEINKLTTQQFIAWKKGIEKLDTSTKQRNKYFGLVKQLVNCASMFHNVSTNVPDRVGGFYDPNEEQREMQFYTLDQFNKFISVIDDIEISSLYTTLYYEGMRLGEALALTWKDIDFKNSKIKISKTLTTKLQNEDTKYTITTPKSKSTNRIIPMTKEVSNALKSLKEHYLTFLFEDELVFVFGADSPIPESTINKKKTQACIKANLPVIRTHDFRHSCASYWINQGMPPIVLAHLLGHSNASITLRVYSHMYPNEMEKFMVGR